MARVPDEQHIGIACSAPSRRQSEGVLANGKSESPTRRMRPVSDGACYVALGVRDVRRCRVTASSVHDSMATTVEGFSS